MGLYRSVGRPLFFAIPPEASHRVAGAFLRSPLPWKTIGGVVDAPSLRTELAGIQLRNPIGLAAGFDKSCALLPGLGDLGFGYVVAGTVTREQRDGYAKPRIVRLRGRRAIVNSMGLPNPGVDAVAGRLRGTRRTSPLLVSLADEEPADVAEGHRLLQPLVDGFELNISSPNSPWRHARTDNPAYLRTVLGRLMPQREKPLFVKLPPFGSPEEREEVLALARLAVDAGADGLTCSNTRPVEEPRLARGRGGLSGPELLEDTVRIVEAVKTATGATVNASGGITTTDDVRRCLDAGATTVQIYTALIYEGPRILRSLTDGLVRVATRRSHGQD